MKLSQNCVFNEFQIQRFKKLWMLATAELSIACRPVINAKDPSAAVLWAFFSLCAFCLWKLFVEVLSSLGSVLKDRGCIIDAKREALWIQNKEGRKYGQDEFLFLVSLKRAFKYIYIFSINWFLFCMCAFLFVAFHFRSWLSYHCHRVSLWWSAGAKIILLLPAQWSRRLLWADGRAENVLPGHKQSMRRFLVTPAGQSACVLPVSGGGSEDKVSTSHCPLSQCIMLMWLEDDWLLTLDSRIRMILCMMRHDIDLRYISTEVSVRAERSVRAASWSLCKTLTVEADAAFCPLNAEPVLRCFTVQ